jgi:hypothetical protein
MLWTRLRTWVTSAQAVTVFARVAERAGGWSVVQRELGRRGATSKSSGCRGWPCSASMSPWSGVKRGGGGVGCGGGGSGCKRHLLTARQKLDARAMVSKPLIRSQRRCSMAPNACTAEGGAVLARTRSACLCKPSEHGNGGSSDNRFVI